MNNDQIEKLYGAFRLPKEEEDKLVCIVQADGPESVSACNKLIKANQYCAAKCASKFQHFQFLQLDFDDLFEYALEGLWKSIFTYDVTREVPLAVYAQKAMRQSLLAAGNSVGNVHGPLPHSTQRDLYTLDKVSNKLRQELKDEPDIEELAIAMKVDVEYILYLRELKQLVKSLDDEDNLGLTIEAENQGSDDDEQQPSPKNSLTLKQILLPFDYEVYVRSIGYDGFDPMTHEEILEDINHFRTVDGKSLKTMEDISIHYNRAALFDRCFD